ncbi:hypothetical protein BD410DRAFT_809530 [Rickenella mellea]|uniref:Uncharacterized protein n=1 Tax=Rickenella mellea TaxID=50990 RepID=A0A4Y7PI75_9AGAM|nr:hypothetical protein BD410DRAFT_809530 [Rickenella mellea]
MTNRHQGMETRNGCLWWVEKRRSKHHEADDNDADVGTECVWVDEWWWQWRLWVYIVVVVVARGSKRRSGSPPDAVEEGADLKNKRKPAVLVLTGQSLDNLVATARFAVRGWDCKVRGEGAEFIERWQDGGVQNARGSVDREIKRRLLSHSHADSWWNCGVMVVVMSRKRKLTGFQCSVKRLAFGIATTEVVHDDLRVKKTSLACVCEPESHAKCPAQAHLARINSQLARDIDGRG